MFLGPPFPVPGLFAYQLGQRQANFQRGAHPAVDPVIDAAAVNAKHRSDLGGFAAVLLD